MCSAERRSYERAMNECFLVIKSSAADMGDRPLSAPFTSPDVKVGPDGRPRAVIWNLGNREVQGVITEFIAFSAGRPIHSDRKQVIGYGNPATIPAHGSVQVTCTGVWQRGNRADVLMAMVYQPELDPIRTPCDPMADRHVGQMCYPWVGHFEGMLGGTSGEKIAVHVTSSNQGLFKVRVFCASNGRLPTHPQVDRVMAPHGHRFRWQESYPARKEDWELVVIDNQRMSIRCKKRGLGPTRSPGQEQTSILLRR